MKPRTNYVGGQALIEGVMMKAGNTVAGAARKKGKIVTKKIAHRSATKKHWLLRLPVVRGCIFLYEMVYLGLKMLAWSADVQAEKKEEKLTKAETAVTIVVSLILGIGLFVVVPYYLTRLFRAEHDIIFNLIDGGIRVAVFVLYLLLIGLLKDVRTMFEYHGAEHAVVNCYEKGLKLTPENAKKFSTVHKRCGTSLLMFVIIISIFAFSLVKTPVWYLNVPLRVLLIPVVVGVSFELLKFSAKYRFLLFDILVLPGLWTQKITTKKPNKRQLEVAIAALKKAV